MASNHERPASTEITVDDETIEVPLVQFDRACRHSKVLKDSQDLRFDIPARDIGANNFDHHTIKIFFEGFGGEEDTWDNPGLDCESLVRLCHAFWWLKCDARALRSSNTVQRLKSRIQTESWQATGSRCANRLVVSLVLGWKDELTASCNELVHQKMDNNDNLLAGLPSAVGQYCDNSAHLLI
jgi:hypothetical protein